jgi:hypothetical protein
MRLRWGILFLLLLAGAVPGQAVNQVPFINQPLVPAASAAGGSGFTLTVNGTGFVSGSVVYWNGSALTTTFVNFHQLTATVPGADIATPGTAWVTVSSGGVTSNLAYFEITNPTTSVSFKNTDFSTGSAMGVAVGDFNGDGTLDLVVANELSNNVSVLLGNSDGTFQPAVNYAVGWYPVSVAVGDFNGDGILDLAVANYGGNNVSVLLGYGDGTFQAAVNYAAGAYPWSVTVGDFNGDGKLDLAVANSAQPSGTSSVSVLLGKGDGTFTNAPGSPFAVGTNPNCVAVGDFNGDGKLDLAVTNGGSNNVSVLLGKGDGTFRNAPGSPIAVGTNPYGVAVGDFNGDGKLDLAVANSAETGGTSSVSVLLGKGDGTFQGPANYAAGTWPQSVAVGDFNGDGKLDLAVGNYGSNNVSLLLGNGDGTFQGAVNYAAGSGPYPVAVGDFDGDGRMDLAVGNMLSSNVSILLQSAPTGGSAQLVGGNAFLGNQTVTGTVTATSFMGNGSGLTGVNAATVANGVYTTGSYADPSWITSLAGSKITGTVASAATAGTASNATALGGVAAGNYARLDIGNSFAGDQSITGNLSLTGTLLGGALLPPSGTATSSGGFSSKALDLNASAFNSGTSAAQVEAFQWQAEPAGNNTASPSATLNLLFGAGGGSPAETGLSINANGTMNFASGQRFPGTGSGTITGVTAGTDLTGGGTSGSVTVNLDTTMVPTLGAASNTFTGSVIASSFTGSGSGLTNLNASNLGSGTLPSSVLSGTYSQALTLSNASNSFSGNGAALTGLTAANISAGTAGINISGNAATATTAASATTAATASNALSLGGVAAGNYARLDIGNSFTGNQSVTGNVSATGSVSGGTASFSGALTAAGAVLPATGIATATQGFNSNPMDLQASSFNSGTSAAVPQLFRWQAEPAGNDTASPSGTLNLLYLSGSGTPAETGLSIASNGRLTFASGQTFPGTGSGTVTSVGSGSGLTGGPITTSGTLSIATGGVTNAMLANPSLTVTAGSGLSGGGPVALGGSTSLSIASGGVSNPMLANPSLTVTAGTDLTGGGSVALGGNVTLNLDTTKVPTLGAASNSFAGSLTASSFSGAGTGLTGTATALSIGGNAATASNALSLGGVGAGNYARLDIGNKFTGTQTVIGGKVGIGTTKPAHALDVVGDINSSGKVTASGGDVSTTMAGKGLIVKSPDGTKCARIGIDNTGAIVATSVTCTPMGVQPQGRDAPQPRSD